MAAIVEKFVIHSVVQAQLLIDGQSEGAVLWSERGRAGRRSGRRSEPLMALMKEQPMVPPMALKKEQPRAPPRVPPMAPRKE